MTHRPNSLLFATASLLPAGCLVAAAVFAGFWPLIALLSVTLLVLAMDRIGPVFSAETTAKTTLPWLVGSAHFLVLFTVIWAVGRPQHLDVGQIVALVTAAGLYVGQVSNACAHELIHRPDRTTRALGIAVYSSVLNGQHVSSHLLIHHKYAGTSRDPNSAPLGQGFYRFAVAASLCEFRDGLLAENKRRAGHSKRMHPYAQYLGGAAASLVTAGLLGSASGVITLLIVAVHAQMQLLLSDYVQHYGLRRRQDDTGKLEPMGPQHSWNAPQSYSAAMMLNAPRHSDHHMNPARDFAQLRLDPKTMPTLPYSVPVMGALALVPPVWKRLMDPLARQWSLPPGKADVSPVAEFSPAPASQ